VKKKYSKLICILSFYCFLSDTQEDLHNSQMF